MVESSMPTADSSPYGIAVAAYRHHVRSRRDPERVQALRRAAAECGLDVVIADAFRQVCRGSEPDVDVAQALSWLEPAERLEMLRVLFEECVPIRSIAVPAGGVVAPDSELGRLGIAVDQLSHGTDNYPPDPRLLRHHGSVLRDKRLDLVSPLSGRTLTSDTTLLLVAGGARPLIIFRFADDGEPFFLILNTFDGSLGKLFFPNRDLQIGAPPEIPRVLAMLRALVTEFAAATVKHLLHAGERPLALLTGSSTHVGHTVLNELDACHQCIEGGLLDRVDVILEGFSHFAPRTEIFPELASWPVVRVGDLADAYRAVVDGRYLVVRPTSNYWFSAGLGERLRDAARRHQGAEPSRELARARRCWPLLWVEVRSHDRRWANQEDELPQLIDRLATRFGGLGVVLAGWSRMADPYWLDDRLIERDSAVARTIAERVASGVPIFDITGVATIEKMAWGAASTIAIVTYGTGLVFPYLIGGRPCVVHTNSYYTKLLSERGPPLIHYSDVLASTRLVGSEHIFDEDPDHNRDTRNHHVGWRPIYAEVITLAEGLSASPDPS